MITKSNLWIFLVNVLYFKQITTIIIKTYNIFVPSTILLLIITFSLFFIYFVFWVLWYCRKEFVTSIHILKMKKIHFNNKSNLLLIVTNRTSTTTIYFIVIICSTYTIFYNQNNELIINPHQYKYIIYIHKSVLYI